MGSRWESSVAGGFSIVGAPARLVSELARVHDAWHDDVVSSVSSAALVALIVSL